MKRKHTILFIVFFTIGLSILLSYLIVPKMFRQTHNEYQRQLDKKIAEAEMVLYYEITQDKPLLVKLIPNDKEVKIISHLNVPNISQPSLRRDFTHDNSKEYLYGLLIEVVDDSGERLWDNVYWERTKATKIREEGALVEWESAFYFDRKDVMPTDGRLTTVFLSGVLKDVAKSKTKYLKVSLVSEYYRSAVIRCYRRIERLTKDRKPDWKRLKRETRRQLVQHNIYGTDMLTEEEKSGLMAYKWERIFAEGKRDKDYILQPVYLSDSWGASPLAEVVEESEARGFLIHQQRAACVNVRGEGRLKIEVTEAGEHEGNSQVHVYDITADKLQFLIKIQRLNDTGEIFWEEKQVQIPSRSKDGVGEIILDVPAGLHTYTIKADTDCFVRLYVDRFPEMFVGDEIPITYPSEDWYQIEPEVHTVTYYRSLDTDDSPMIEVDVSLNKLYSGYIRIASRLRIEANKSAGVHQYVVHYDILDGQKKSIVKGDYNVQTTASTYDFYYHRQGVIEEYIPSESDYFYLPLPHNAKTIKLWSKQVVDFGLYAYYGGTSRQIYITENDAPKENNAATRNVILSNCRDEAKEWYYFRPNNYEELDELERAISIRWQCRMIKERKSEPKFEQQIEKIAKVIAPDVYEEEVKLLEKTEPNDDELYGSNLTFFEINPNEDIPIRFFDYDNPHNQLPVPMEVVYYKSDSAQSSLPAEARTGATIFIDGEEYDKYSLLNKAGQILLKENPQGMHTVRFSSLFSSRLFINRAPLFLEQAKQKTTSVLWKRRTSYTLRSGQPIILTVQKESNEAKTLNILAYRNSPGDCLIRAKIHNSIPPTPSQSYTAKERTYHIKGWKTLECFDIVTGSWQSKKQRFTLTLGEDLGAGEYQIQFDLLSGGSALLRFLVMEDAPYFINSNQLASLNLIGPGVLKLELKPKASLIAGDEKAICRLISKRLNHQGEVFFEERKVAKTESTTEIKFMVPSGLHTYSFSTPGRDDCHVYFYVDKTLKMLPGKYQLFPSVTKNTYVRIEPESYITPYYYSSSRGLINPLTFNFPISEPFSRQAIRIVSRLRLSENERELPQSYTVYYEIFTTTGKVISRGKKELTATKLAVYDRYISQKRYGASSEASYFYIHIPHKSGRLRVWSDNEKVALALYSQTPDYVKDVYMPEDELTSKKVNVLDSSHNRQWHPLMPDNHKGLFFAGLMTKIKSQKLLIKERDIQAEAEAQKRWRTIVPEIYQSEVKILEKTSIDASTDSPISLSSAFFQMHLNKPVQLAILSQNKLNKTPIDVEFVFRAKSIHESQTIHLWLDGHKHSSYQLTQVTGSFTVERIPQGIHTFEFRSEREIDEVNLFVNQQPLKFDIKNNYFWRKRTFYSFTARSPLASLNGLPEVSATSATEPLTLFLYKTRPDTLSLNVVAYFETPSSERCALKVKIIPLSVPDEMLKASENYTPCERIYYLKSEPTGHSEDIIPITDLPLIHSPFLIGPIRFIIGLQDDLDVGKYAIHFELIGQSSGMLRFFFSEDAPFVLKKGQFAALNLFGSGNLKIEALNQSVTQSLRITQLAATGEVVTENISLPPPDDFGISASNIKILPGFVTVRIENTNRNDISLRFYVDHAPEMLVDNVSFPPLTDGQPWTRIEPNVGTYNYFRASPSDGFDTPLATQPKGLEILLPQNQKGHQTLRITSRIPNEINDKTLQRCYVDYQIFDNIGHKIAEGDFTIEAARSNDTFYYPKQFRIGSRNGIDSSEAPSEAVYRYVELPQNAAVLKFYSEKNIDFRFHRRLSDVERITYLPEDYVSSPKKVQLRDKATSERGWEVIIPANHKILARIGKIVKIETQKQLIVHPKEEEVELTKKVAKTLSPDDYDEKVYIFEPYQVIDQSEIEPSTATYCRLPLDENILLDIVNYDSPNAQVPTNIQLFYKFPLSLKTRDMLSNPISERSERPRKFREANGGEAPRNGRPFIAVFVDTKRFVEFPIMSPQGRFVIPPIQPGPHQFRVENQGQNPIDADGVEFFINQLPEDLTSASIWKRRTVYTLTDEKPLVISLVKPSRKPITLNVVTCYDNEEDTARILANSATRFTILVTIDNGIRTASPNQPSTQYTALIRKYDIKNQPSSAFYVNKNGIKPGQAQTFFVPLYDDIPPGRHQLSFKLLSGKSAKIRVFIMESDGIEEKVKFWKESTDEIRG